MKDAQTEEFLWGPWDIVLGLQPPWETWARNSGFPKAEVNSAPKRADEHPPAPPAAGLPQSTRLHGRHSTAKSPRAWDAQHGGQEQTRLLPGPPCNSSWDFVNLNTTDNSSFWDSTQCYFQQSFVVLEHLQPAQVKQFAQRKCSMKGKHKSMHRKRPESPSFLIHHTALGIKYSLKIYIINC